MVREQVALNSQKLALSLWPETVPADFLGNQTVAETLTSNSERLQDIRKHSQVFGYWLRYGSEQQVLSFLERTRVHGEMNAFRWVRETYPEHAYFMDHGKPLPGFNPPVPGGGK
jgi:hypothetical protein